VADDDFELGRGNVSVRTVNLDSSNGYLNATVRIERQRREWHPLHGAIPEDLPADVREVLLDWLTGTDGLTAEEWREQVRAAITDELLPEDPSDRDLVDLVYRGYRAGEELAEVVAQLLSAEELEDALKGFKVAPPPTKRGAAKLLIVPEYWLRKHVVTYDPPVPEFGVGSWASVRDGEYAGTVGKVALAGMQPLDGEPRYILELEDGDWMTLDSLAEVVPVEGPEIKLDREVPDA